jgi:hypothetical protein
MISARKSAGLLALLPITAALAGCSPRSLPASFPASSAASPQGAEAPAPRVGVALSEDPPLPGESTEGWHGLGPAPDAGGDAQHQHQHHHGHDHGQQGQGEAPKKAPEGDHAH